MAWSAQRLQQCMPSNPQKQHANIQYITPAGKPRLSSQAHALQLGRTGQTLQAAAQHTCRAPETSCSGGGGDGNIPRAPGRSGGGSGDGGAGGGSPFSLRQLATLAVVAGLALPALFPAPAEAAAAASKRSRLASQQQDEGLLSSWQLDAFVDRMWDLSGPILNNMGFSGVLGACTAAALKWVGRTLAASVGLGLVLVQVLSHYNVITVNWSVVHQQARQVLDSTGDGRLDQDDFKRSVKQGLVVLSEGVPSLSGFLVGFLLGLKVF